MHLEKLKKTSVKAVKYFFIAGMSCYLVAFALYPAVAYPWFQRNSLFRRFAHSMMVNYPGHGIWAFFTNKNGQTLWPVYFQEGRFVALPAADIELRSGAATFRFPHTHFRILQVLRFDYGIRDKVSPWPCQLLNLRKNVEVKLVPYYETVEPLNQKNSDKAWVNSLPRFSCANN